MAAIIVGDVHGCIEELVELLEKYAAGREVIFVGDLVSKGPDSHAVVERARTSGARAVCGNHDHLAIHWWESSKKNKEARVSKKHHATFETLSEDDLAWLTALPYSLALEEHNTVVVHGGLVPGVAIADQDERHLMNLRSMAGGRPSKRIEGVPWATTWHGPERVVFGHDAVRGLQRENDDLAIGLDTGCVYGGALSALLLPEVEIVQVPAKRAWCPT